MRNWMKIFGLVVWAVLANPVAAERATDITPSDIEPKVVVSAGTLERFANFPSKYIKPRTVEVWLPPGYTPQRRYAVLYMHDGQMLFDPNTTWNKQAWKVDEVAAKLMIEGKTREFIVVAPWHAGRYRHAEFFPQRFIPHIEPPAERERFVTDALQAAPASDAYLQFLVSELKPFVDRRYATLPDRDNTYLMGASMGGLISIYALLEYPETFGGAAALSTHWIGSFERNTSIPGAAIEYLRAKLPPPGAHRIYMDRGTIDLDEKYDQAQPLIDALLGERGYREPWFVTRVFVDASHTERDWNRRLEIPLQFLFASGR